MQFRMRAAAFAVAFGVAATLLTAPSARSAPDKPQQDSWSANARVVTGTVLEKGADHINIKRDSGELDVITYDEPGLTVKVDSKVVMGSRVKVTEHRTGNSRALTVELEPAN
jgi:hypothetical protein